MDILLEGIGWMFFFIGVALVFNGFPDINIGNTKNYYDSNDSDIE